MPIDNANSHSNSVAKSKPTTETSSLALFSAFLGSALCSINDSVSVATQQIVGDAKTGSDTVFDALEKALYIEIPADKRAMIEKVAILGSAAIVTGGLLYCTGALDASSQSVVSSAQSGIASLGAALYATPCVDDYVDYVGKVIAAAKEYKNTTDWFPATNFRRSLQATLLEVKSMGGASAVRIVGINASHIIRTDWDDVSDSDITIMLGIIAKSVERAVHSD